MIAPNLTKAQREVWNAAIEEAISLVVTHCLLVNDDELGQELAAELMKLRTDASRAALKDGAK